MKKIAVVISLAIISLLSVGGAFALSDEQLKVVAGECETIHQVLHSLQKSDSKMRVKLGYHYETVLSKYMIPLNSRLVKNSISNTELIELQTNFKEAKQNFSDDFVTYQKNLESLIDKDCTRDPNEFYEALEGVRNDRRKVRQDVIKLNGLVKKFQNAIVNLKESL